MSPSAALATLAVGIAVLSTVQACIRTGGGTPPVTSCGTCSPTALRLVPGDNMNTITPTTTTPTVGADGCQRMTATCDATATGEAGATTQMDFQDGLAGPGGQAPRIDADLVCRNGQWMFTQNGATRTITEVGCAYAGGGGETPACQMCTADFEQVSEPPGQLTVSPPMIVNGCQQVQVTCATRGGGTFLEFNMFGGPDFEQGNDVSVPLTCNADGRYQFENPNFANPIVVDLARCIAGDV